MPSLSNRLRCCCLGSLSLLLVFTVVHRIAVGQDCSTFDPQSTASCADTFYVLDGTQNPLNLTGGAQVDGTGTVIFLGEDMFTNSLPDNILSDYFASVIVALDDPSDTASVGAEHRGQAIFLPIEAQTGQDIGFGSQHKTVLTPVWKEGNSTFEIKVIVSGNWEVRDPPANATNGVVQMGTSLNVKQAQSGNPLLDIGQGVMVVDSADPIMPVSLQGPLNPLAGVFGTDLTEPTPGQYFLEFDGEFTLTVLNGEKIEVNSQQFGAIFTDGFESGNAISWSTSSLNTLQVTLSSDNPQVRFTVEGAVIPEPCSAMIGVVAMALSAARRRQICRSELT